MDFFPLFGDVFTVGESTLTVSEILERIDSQRHARARVIANKMEKERE